jgi:aminopeptidase N
VRSGWVLADAAEWFFPVIARTPETLARAEALIADETLDPSIRRRLVDEADQVSRMLAVQRAYPHP